MISGVNAMGFKSIYGIDLKNNNIERILEQDYKERYDFVFEISPLCVVEDCMMKTEDGKFVKLSEEIRRELTTAYWNGREQFFQKLRSIKQSEIDVREYIREWLKGLYKDAESEEEIVERYLLFGMLKIKEKEDMRVLVDLVEAQPEEKYVRETALEIFKKKYDLLVLYDREEDRVISVLL